MRGLLVTPRRMEVKLAATRQLLVMARMLTIDKLLFPSLGMGSKRLHILLDERDHSKIHREQIAERNGTDLQLFAQSCAAP